MQIDSKMFAAIDNFRNALMKETLIHHKRHFPNAQIPTIEVSYGRKYAKIIKKANDSYRDVHCFVDMQNGNILMAASWNAPSTKHPRGNIFQEDVLSGVSIYGAKYLR